MRLNPVEKLGIFLWIVLPILAAFWMDGTWAEYAILILYILGIVVSIVDIFTINKALTITAFSSWALFFWVGLAVNNPKAYPITAWTLGLKEARYGNGTVLCFIAVLSAIVLLISLVEEITVEEKMVRHKEQRPQNHEPIRNRFLEEE